MTKIICPNCESIESASIEYFHECSNCGYIITDSDWQEVVTDMTHCRGDNCPQREECYRYWLHKHSKAIIASYFASSAYDEETNKCRYFIKTK